MQHVLSAATATLADRLRTSLSGQYDEDILLPSTWKTSQSAAVVSDIAQWHACDIIAAIAGED